MSPEAITKEQWAALEERLKRHWVSENLQYQGHEICIQKERLKENQYCLVVYIDGTWCGKWMDGTDETYGPLVKLFWRERKFAVHKPKAKAQLIKSFGKRRAREIFSNLDKVIIHYAPYFATAASIVRQFKKVEGLTLKEPEKLQGAQA